MKILFKKLQERDVKIDRYKERKLAKYMAICQENGIVTGIGPGTPARSVYQAPTGRGSLSGLHVFRCIFSVFCSGLANFSGHEIENGQSLTTDELLEKGSKLTAKLESPLLAVENREMIVKQLEELLGMCSNK
jgi:hypothetical protein